MIDVTTACLKAAGTADVNNDSFMMAAMIDSRLSRHFFSRTVGSTSFEHDVEGQA